MEKYKVGDKVYKWTNLKENRFAPETLGTIIDVRNEYYGLYYDVQWSDDVWDWDGCFESEIISINELRKKKISRLI